MKRALAFLAFAACDTTSGVVSVSLTTAPGSTLLDGVQTLRMEITNPPEVVTAERDGSGFDVALELPATSALGAVIIDGYDAQGNLVATGRSPTFAFGGVSGRLVIYMAEPDSVGLAPEALGPARSELGVGLLPYGAILVGGRASDGASGAVEIYNAYDHTLIAGLPLPSARTAAAVAVGAIGVYIFGGLDSGGAPTATLWRFDTTVMPSGAYFEIGDKAGFARAGDTLVPLGNEQYLLTGTPAAQLVGLEGTLVAREDIASLPPAAVTLAGNDGVATALFAGAAGIVRFRGSFDVLAAPGRAGGALVAVGGGKAALVCGGTTDALRIDAASGTAETIASVPSTAKTGCAAAATRRHLLIAGGTTGAGVDGSVEIFDANTLAPVVSATLSVPRTGAVAIPLPNDQILIAGGVDAAGAPVAALELFTPTSR